MMEGVGPTSNGSARPVSGGALMSNPVLLPTVKPDDPNIVYIGAVGSSPGGNGALQRYDYNATASFTCTLAGCAP